MSQEPKGYRVSLIEIIVLGIALAMDAFAVTISNCFAYQGNSRLRSLAQPIAFGLFQGLMPCIGFALGSLISGAISHYAGIITFLILGFIGGKMIWDAFHEDEAETSTKALPLSVLLFQVIATSIDALAVGVSFAALSVNVVAASGTIALTTLLVCIIALLIGRRFGSALGNKATIIGGVVLMVIGLKSLLF